MNLIEQLLTGFFVFLLFGLCIFVHELGHFLVAKWRGLHIVAFSIGFKKIWAFKRGGVEYRIGALPFGGYVDLPQLEPGTAQILTPDGKPLPPARPSDRILTALAGPLFNIFFGILIGIALWIHGIPLDSPKMRSFEIASIEEDSPEFRAGLRKGDIVYEINDKKFYKNWSGIVEEILFTIGDVTLSVKRGAEDFKVKYSPVVNTKQGKLEKLAFPFFKPKIPLVVNRFKKSSPAEKAGIKKGDLIFAINGDEINDQEDYIKKIDKSNGEPIDITVLRNGQKLLIAGVKPVEEEEHGSLYRIGVSYEPVPEFEQGWFGNLMSKMNLAEKPKYQLRVLGLIEDSPALAAGLKEGDIITKIDGKEFQEAAYLNKTVQEKAGGPVKITIKRNEDTLDFEIVPKLTKFWSLGTGFVFYYHPNPAEQFADVMVKTYKSLRSVLSNVLYGKSSLKPRHFSGPVGIVHGIWVVTSHSGIIMGLYFVVLITYSLAVFNLLPMPVLDGGHIAMACFEIVFRKKIPDAVLKPVMYVFVSLLIMLMLFVTFNDLRRLFSSFAN